MFLPLLNSVSFLLLHAYQSNREFNFRSGVTGPFAKAANNQQAGLCHTAT